MKKLVQLLIVSVMAVSCLFFAVSCLDSSGDGSGVKTYISRTDTYCRLQACGISCEIDAEIKGDEQA